jgi:hypothetical protein
LKEEAAQVLYDLNNQFNAQTEEADREIARKREQLKINQEANEIDQRTAKLQLQEFENKAIEFGRRTHLWKGVTDGDRILKDVNSIWNTDNPQLSTAMLYNRIETSPDFDKAKKEYHWNKHLLHRNPIDIQKREEEGKAPKPNVSNKLWSTVRLPDLERIAPHVMNRVRNNGRSLWPMPKTGNEDLATLAFDDQVKYAHSMLVHQGLLNPINASQNENAQNINYIAQENNEYDEVWDEEEDDRLYDD